MGGLRERVTSLWLFKSFIWGSSSGFPLANHLTLPGSESTFGLTQGPPLCMCTSLSQDGFPCRGLWEAWYHLLWGCAPSLFDPQGGFLNMCSQGGLLDLKNEKYVVSLSLIWAGLSSSLLLPLSLSWSICPQGTDSSCSAWGPSISCLNISVIIQCIEFCD